MIRKYNEQKAKRKKLKTNSNNATNPDNIEVKHDNNPTDNETKEDIDMRDETQDIQMKSSDNNNDNSNDNDIKPNKSTGWMISFSLQSSCYATMFIRELLQNNNTNYG